MMTHTINKYTRVSWTTFPDHARPYHVRVEAYVPSRQWWETVRWEQYASRDERDARLRELERGFSEGRYAIYYETPVYPRFAAIQQKSANIWLFRLYDTAGRLLGLTWNSHVWSLPFEERPENWVELHGTAQNAHEMRLVERMFGATRQELEDDQLFWRLYVENAPAEPGAP